MKKKWFQLILCLVVAVSVLTCTALALTVNDVVAGDGVTCTVDGDKVTGFTVTCDTDLVTGNEYVLLIVKTDLKAATPAALLEAVKTAETAPYDVGEGTILYIDQAATDSGVKFEDFLPKSVTNSVVLLGGEFANSVTSPKLLGVIMGNGVDVTGQVTSYNPNNATTVSLCASGTTEAAYTAEIAAATGSGKVTQDFTVPGVAAGTYDLVVTKSGHVSYTVTDVSVSDATDVDTLIMLCGDVDKNEYINFDDLGVILAGDNYDKLTGESGVNAITDLDGNGAVNFDDVSILLMTDNYDKPAIKAPYVAK